MVAESALRDGLPADTSALHLAHLLIAECYLFDGDHAGALRVMAEARQAIEYVGADAFSIATMAGAEAVFTAMRGDFDWARPLADEVLRLAQAGQNPSTLTLALFALGFAHWEDDPLRAVQALDESVSLAAGRAT